MRTIRDITCDDDERPVRVAVSNHYRLTKYDPALRDASGAYTGDDWTALSDVGQTFNGEQLTLSTYLDIEGRHLVVLAAFLEESGTSLVIAEGVEDDWQRTFHVRECARLSQLEAIEVVRQMLRGEGWCRLADDDRFYIHVGWDYYVYVGTTEPCERSVALARANGLFVDKGFVSPYLVEDD